MWCPLWPPSCAAATATNDRAPRTRVSNGRTRRMVRVNGCSSVRFSVSYKRRSPPRPFPAVCRADLYKLETRVLAGSGLGVDDHVGDIRALAPDSLLDLARARVRLVEPARAFERERQERNETVVGAQEAQLPRRLAGFLLDHARHDRGAVGLDLARRTLLRKWLEMCLHAGDLGHRGADRRLEVFGDRVRLLEGEVAW